MRDAVIVVTKNKGKYFANAFFIGRRMPIILVTEYLESNLTIVQHSRSFNQGIKSYSVPATT